MKHYHKNPRQITAAQFERLQETLAELGDLSGIVHDLNSDEIIGGNQRLEALGIMTAMPEIVERHDPPTETGTVALGYYIVNGERFSYRAVRWTPAQCEKANIVANLAGGDWNWDALASWDVSALVSWGFDTEALQGWNNDAANLSLMIGAEAETEAPEDHEVDPDRAAELVESWGVDVGQTWLFDIENGGESSLYVGPAELARIRCDLAVYDPPFDWNSRQQENALSWTAWRKSLLLGLASCMPLVERQDFLHWWVWDSGIARFGGQGYKPMSACAVALVFGEKPLWYEKQALGVLDSYGIEHYDWPMQVVKIQDSLQKRTYKHEKPPALWDYIVALYSTTGDVIGDPFAGSGSVAAACVRLGRAYRGAEIEPRQAALTLQRLCDMGLTPHLAETQPDHL